MANDYSKFWTKLRPQINLLIETYSLNGLNPVYEGESVEENFLEVGSTIPNCSFAIAFKGLDPCEQLPQRTQVEFIMDKPNNECWNNAVFEKLKANRQVIEAPFYGNVFWQQYGAERSCPSINRRVVAAVYPFHLNHDLRVKELAALETWTTSSLFSLYHVINENMNDAITEADQLCG